MNETSKSERFYKRTVGFCKAVAEAVAFGGVTALFVYFCSIA